MIHLDTTTAGHIAAKARIFGLLLAATTGAALAESPTVATEPFVSSRTRAEVLADLAAFKKSGVNPWSVSYQPTHHLRSTTTREEVQAAALASSTVIAAFGGEDSGAVHLSRARQQGIAPEVLAAQAGHAR